MEYICSSLELHGLMASQDVEVHTGYFALRVRVRGRRERGRTIECISLGILLALNDNDSKK